MVPRTHRFGRQRIGGNIAVGNIICSKGPHSSVDNQRIVIATIFLYKLYCFAIEISSSPQDGSEKGQYARNIEFQEAGGPVDDKPIEYNIRAKDLVDIPEEKCKFRVPTDAKDRIVSKEQVLKVLEENSKADSSSPTQIFDTRGPGGFNKGHIPGSTNVPFARFIDPDNVTRFKSKSDLETVLEESGISKDDKQKDLILSCGACISVCHLEVALAECGYKSPILYDGSWGEWGKDPDTPKRSRLKSDLALAHSMYRIDRNTTSAKPKELTKKSLQ